jgi:hypothetical protein
LQRFFAVAATHGKARLGRLQVDVAIARLIVDTGVVRRSHICGKEIFLCEGVQPDIGDQSLNGNQFTGTLENDTPQKTALSRCWVLRTYRFEM